MASDVTINVTVTQGGTIDADLEGATVINTSVEQGGEISAEVIGGGTGPQGDQGDQGIQGVQGIQGEPGSGVPNGGTISQVLVKLSGVDQDTDWHTLVKADIGLGSVDNTSDASKPVSTATQTALDGKQTLDADLTTIAALDSSTAGALVTDGAGWIRKTYAQLKTALGLVKGDVGLGNVDNTSDANKPVSTAQQTALDLKENLANKATDFSTVNNTLYPTVQAVNNAINTAVVGLLDYRGTYDASSNLFPASGGSGLLGAILKGDFWIASVAGTLGGTSVTIGDLIIALIDTPGQTAGNWDIVSNELGYVPENVANKDTDSTFAANSDTKYPSQKAVKTAVDGKQPLDSDLTTIAGLTATSDNVMQAKAGAWASRTLAQLMSDLAGLGTTFQPLDSDLTTIAGLTATTDNFMVATASAWASRTPTQARSQLGLGSIALLSTITEANITLADNTTNDVSTAKHGFVPKATNVGSFLKDDGTWAAIPGGGDALTSNPLSQFASTTSLQLKGVLSDETGSGAAVFATSPALVTPTGIVKGDVGLGNVDNTSNATERAATATLTNKEVSGGVVESNVFHDLLTTQSITLPARDFQVLNTIEITSTHVLEISGTGTLEIVTTDVIRKPYNPYCFRAYNSSTTTLTDNSTVQVLFQTEIYDYNNNFASSAYTAPFDGVYNFSGSVAIDSAVSTPVDMIITIFVDGAGHTQGGRMTAGSDFALNIAADIFLRAGQVVTLRFFQNSAGNEATNAQIFYTWFAGHLVHAI